MKKKIIYLKKKELKHKIYGEAKKKRLILISS